MNVNENYAVMTRARETLEAMDYLGSYLKELRDRKKSNKDNIHSGEVVREVLADDVCALEDVIGYYDSARSSIEKINDEVGTEMRPRHSRWVMKEEPFEVFPEGGERRKEVRTVRLQFLTTPSLEAEFKDYCRACGLSMNEVINRLMEAVTEGSIALQKGTPPNNDLNLKS